MSKKYLITILAALSISSAIAANKIQNEDVKSETELNAAGSNLTHLVNTSKIYDPFNGQKLSDSISSGALATNGVKIWGAIKFNPDSNCVWDNASLSNTPAAFTAAGACPTPAPADIYGNASQPATMIPAIKFASLPAGYYRFSATGRFSAANNGSGASSLGLWQFSDGTNTTGIVVEGSNFISSTNFSQSVPGIEGYIRYATDQTNKTIQIFCAPGTIAGSDCYTEAVKGPLVITVEKFPL